ncbi:MAG: CHAT domain-containing protein [Stigonema ocellatum SAG 48.90 = DSM 106950]|nr:CHAT domain-containing protein [Stigonema ocellatum SAG 48.90 = DSM 106950]
MSRFFFLAVLTQIVAASSSLLLAADAANYSQTEPLQMLQSGNARVLLQQGLKSYQKEQFSIAVQVLEQAAIALKMQGDVLNQALALNYVALADQQLGQLPQASKAIADSLVLLPQNGINSQEYLSVRAQGLNIQGQIQLAQGQSEKALISWEEATKLYRKNGDNAGEIGSKINESQALQALGLYRRARITLTQVNQQLQQQPDSLLKATGLLSLGNTLRIVGVLDQKDPKSNAINSLGSQQALQQSLAVASKLNSLELAGEIYLSLGNTAQALGNNIDNSKQKDFYNAEALNYYQQAAAHSASPITRLKAQINQLRLSVEAGEKPNYQTLLPQIQSQLATLGPSRKTIYAKISLVQTLACLKQRSEVKGLLCASSETSAKQTKTKGTQTPEWGVIAEIAATAVEQAKSLGDKRAEAYALGTLGGLYEQTEQWGEAQKLTQQALGMAESIASPDIGYRWQWQLGRILKERGNEPGAIAAYSKAVDNLKSLRSDLVAINRDVQFSFREGVEPIYRELVSLLLQSSNNKPTQDSLIKARSVIESLQLAELDNFFRRACLNVKTIQLDQVDRSAAVIYPVVLANRLEVILSLPSASPKQKSGEILRYPTAVSQKEVEQTVDLLRQKLETRSTSEFLPVSQKVYDWVMRPIARDLANHQIKNLVFVLDGSLRNIPMGALHDGKQYLVENYNIALTPGLQLLNPQPLSRTKLQVIAGGLSEGLPFVKNELDEIKLKIPATQVLLNERFTTNAIENVIKSLRAPVVHLATHGQFSSKEEDNYIPTFDDKLSVTELSQLIKARATNQRGVIELLVLSACKTAAGDKRAALGIAGIAVRSGARSTLASLWAVDDEATAKIMGEFYKDLNRPNITKSEAFKLAQLTLLKDPSGQYQHPYYWAPYVLVGNWL